MTGGRAAVLSTSSDFHRAIVELILVMESNKQFNIRGLMYQPSVGRKFTVIFPSKS